MYDIISPFGRLRLYQKIMLMMRLTTVILIASLMQVSAATFGQRVTLNKANASLFSVLKDIRKQTGYGFYYDPATIPQSQKVSVSVSDATIEETLSDVLKGLNLVYKIDGKIVTIKAKEKASFLERVVATLAEINVSGRVVDADGRGLPGASVSVKGKGGKAVSTGANGSFYLKGVGEDAVLVVSFIGYVTKEVKAAKELGDVVLEVSLSKLDEVQVIAYGTTTQRLSTGNVTTIKADVIEKQPVNNPLLALQGRVPGLFIEQATGYAGTGVKVRIQGTNSIANGNDPLYVIDGIPYTSQLLIPTVISSFPITGSSGGTQGATQYGSPLSFINPADIESIDILKDADATSIYGSRAANGAILITTKKGKAGEIRANLNFQSGWGNVTNRLNLMNSEQYLEMRREALKNDLIQKPGVGDYDLNGDWDNTRYTDWQKELIGGTAHYNDFQASISGGGLNTTFVAGAGYHRETNVISGDYSDKKSSIHFSINSASDNQRFRMQFSGSYLEDNNLLPQVDLTQTAMMLSPVAPLLYNSDGSFNYQRNSTGTRTFFNPMTYLNGRFQNKTDNLIGNGILSYQILPGLDIKGSFGYTSLKSNIIDYRIFEGLAPESIRFSERQTNFRNSAIKTWSIEPQLTYKRTIEKGKFEVLLGSTIQKENRDGSALTATGFNTDQVMEDIKSARTLTAGSSISSVYRYFAVFGRMNYNWADKYIVNLTARRDGSSRFGWENQFHNFGAVGAAWIFSEERWLNRNLNFLSFGKLRASFGTTGSDQIPDYQYLNLYDAIPFISSPYQGTKVFAPTGLTNPYLQWEETQKLQFGLDLGFVNDRILFNANYSRNRSSNQLLSYILPIQAGFDFIQKNLPATVQNTGWEFSLSTSNLKLSNFQWTTNINLTVPKNKLVDFDDFENSSYNTEYAIGESINLRKKYHFLGVDPSTGSYQFEDRNGQVTLNPVPPGMPDNDATRLINLDPKYYGGFQNNFTYKGFELDFLFQFAKQVGQNYALGELNTNGTGNFNSGLGNVPVSLFDRWKQTGDMSFSEKFSTLPSTGRGNAVYYSDAVWGDASYIRLKNISLSWSLPTSTAKSLHLQNCRLSLRAQNLFTITNYIGLDPETKSSSTLPPLRVITLGLQVGL